MDCSLLEPVAFAVPIGLLDDSEPLILAALAVFQHCSNPSTTRRFRPACLTETCPLKDQPCAPQGLLATWTFLQQHNCRQQTLRGLCSLWRGSPLTSYSCYHRPQDSESDTQAGIRTVRVRQTVGPTAQSVTVKKTKKKKQKRSRSARQLSCASWLGPGVRAFAR